MKLRPSLYLAKLMAKHKRLKWLLFGTFLLLINALIVIYKYDIDVLQRGLDCASEWKQSETTESTQTQLGDVLLTDPQPILGRSIFFLETSCNHNKPNILKLRARQACAIESAARHNPNRQVFVLFARPTYRYETIRNQRDGDGDGSLIDAVLSYKNVQLRQMNLWTYAAGSPIEDWLKKGPFFRSRYLINHMSDMLRLLTLYRFGGIYLDMDVVVLRSMEDVPLNFAGVESDKNVANGVMSMAPTGIGHEIAESCLRDFQQNFDGRNWGNNGPGVITRMAKRICNTTSLTQLQNDRKRCHGFQFFDSNAFYSVPFEKWRYFFDSQLLEETLALTNESYLVHVWNKFSKDTAIKFGSRTAYGKFAEQNCPRSYAASGEYF